MHSGHRRCPSRKRCMTAPPLLDRGQRSKIVLTCMIRETRSGRSYKACSSRCDGSALREHSIISLAKSATTVLTLTVVRDAGTNATEKEDWQVRPATESYRQMGVRGKAAFATYSQLRPLRVTRSKTSI
jgi:hypothetical protein